MICGVVISRWCRVARRCVHGNTIGTLIHAEMEIRGYSDPSVLRSMVTTVTKKWLTHVKETGIDAG